MKLWIKISSENRRQGAWFFDLKYARQCAKRWEMVIPVEIPWPDAPDDGDHSRDGEYAGELATDIMDDCYRQGVLAGKRETNQTATPASVDQPQ